MPIISSDVLCCRNWQVGYLYHLVNKCFFGLECMSVNAFVNSHLQCALKRPDGKTHCSPLTYMWHCPLNFHLGGWMGDEVLTLLKANMRIQNKTRKEALLSTTSSMANPLRIPPLHHPVFSVQGPARQKTLSENPCWEPRLCHHAAHCGVDKEKSGCGSSEHMFQ